tara:strand:+ start:6841 stop:7176 length:336 start_codon:yes stop_codon:yes gene_type:complete
MTTPNAGWEARYEDIKAQFHLYLDFALLESLDRLQFNGLIDQAESERAYWKLKLLRPFVARLALNMVKGTIKYPDDDWSIETWSDMGLDDKADSVNYDLLRDHALRQAGLL